MLKVMEDVDFIEKDTKHDRQGRKYASEFIINPYLLTNHYANVLI